MRRTSLVVALFATTIMAFAAAAAATSPSALEQRIAARQARERSLRSGISSDSRALGAVQGSLGAVQRRLGAVQADLDRKRAALLATQEAERRAHARLVVLQDRLARAERALAANLVGSYKADTPDPVSVILSSHGFADLLERFSFMKRVSRQDNRIITEARTARTEVIAQATRLGNLEARQQRLAAAILAQRNQVAQIRLGLAQRQVALARARNRKSGELAAVRTTRQRLQTALDRIRAEQAASAPAAARGVSPGAVHQGGGFTFPMPAGSASPPGSWTLDQGVDISAPGHTPLLAVGSGTVVLHGIGGFGPSAPVLHLDDGRYVYYGHAGPGGAVAIGTHVGAGQQIGEVGAGIVGISTGPHLEIGFAGPSGAPLGGTAGQMMALLQGSYGG
jgi:murein DD-endopeptidase MepM/ murein hydrolase activator NlpD